MFPIALFNPLPFLISISTLCGVVVHDTKIDQLTGTMLAVPAIIASYEGLSGIAALHAAGLHTHSEQQSVSEAVRNLANQAPRIQPRTDRDKKHLMQKNVARGHHPFDNYNLPFIPETTA